MVGDVNQQILLDEALDPGLRRHRRNDLERSRSNVDVCDENSRMEVVESQVLRKVSHLLYANGGIGQELNPDGTDVGAWRVWVAGRGRIGVSLKHDIGRSRRESHELSPVDLLV